MNPIEWTDSIEHTLDMVRLNCVNLSEYHHEKYDLYKSRSNLYTFPVLIISAGNAYVALGIHKYLKQSYISDINCGASVLIVIIIIIQFLLNYQNQMEEQLLKFKEYYFLSAQIFNVLSIDRSERKVDGKFFLNEKFAKYEELVKTSDIIQLFKDDARNQPENMITKYVIDTKDMNEKSKYLFDHWNILYQPKLYALKKKNAKIIKNLREPFSEKKNDQSTAPAVTEESKEKESKEKKLDADEEQQIYENPFYNPFSYDIFKNDFMKERLENDQKQLDSLKRAAIVELHRKNAKRVQMTFL
jgi:hypothetical protein